MEVGIGDERAANENRNTTPEALELQALLADMVAAGNDSVVMEATSHGLVQARTRNVDFDIGILTNGHQRAPGVPRRRGRTIGRRRPCSSNRRRWPILNADDPSAAYFRGITDGEVMTYGHGQSEADVPRRRLRPAPTARRFTVCRPPTGAAGWICQLPGSFNVQTRWR